MTNNSLLKIIKIFSIFIVFICSFILISPTKIHAVDTWYDANYSYRRPITVTNNIASALTDFQIKVTVDTSVLVSAGKMNSDCSDMRFTDSDKTTVLNYFIQNGCNTTSTVVWVKVPNLSASSSQFIYMYYGYPSASATSSGDNTFDFFDDFNGTTIDTTKWSDWNPDSFGTMSVSGGTLAINMPSTGGSSTVRNRGVISNNTFTFPASGSVIETYSKWAFASPGSNRYGTFKSISLFNSANPTGVCSWDNYNAGGTSYHFTYLRFYGLLTINLNQFTFSKCNNNAYTEVVPYNYGTDSSWSNPANFVLEQYRWFYSSGNRQSSFRSDNLGASWGSLWGQQSDSLLPLPQSLYLSWNIQNRSIANQNVSIDWFRIRKYASTEPTSSIGNEQLPPATPSVPTLILPINTTNSVSQTPTFQTVSTDINNDNLQYELQICTNSAMTNNCVTFTSANSGWSGADVGTSTFSAGTTATYVLQVGNSLAFNTTYFWKTRSIDPDGSNIWSSTQASPYSFTTFIRSFKLQGIKLKGIKVR